ncbi:uncharacterized protein [Lepeophtheirus salmonis]|uniref:Ig-like domain-containing protein n=1 Tax=Lepeophtheirus salmonis TaxID=72036 RepID=A0A0K2V3S9_LEPSM|nr:uncharacterized protein LOC121116169 [Lepeophtheirus salmonis]
MILISLCILLLPAANMALRFTHDPIQMDKGVMEIGTKTKLTCNYVRFRTESIRHIAWRFEYNGVAGKFYDYHVATGAKNPTSYSFITIPEDGEINEKEIEIILNDFRAPEIKITCEVDALRDNGYGKLHHSTKEAHEVVTVVDTADWSIKISPEPEHKRRIERNDESLSFKCISKGARPPPALSFSIKGQNLSEFEELAVVRHSYESQDEIVVEGQLNKLTPDLFENGNLRLVIKCYAKYGDSVLGKSELEMIRANYMDESNEQPSYQRRGKDAAYDEDKVLEKRFLDVSDPARSVHPTMSYDSFDGYAILIADNLIPDNDYVTPHVTLLGELPPRVKNSLAERLYGRLNNLSPEKIMLKVEPAKILNMLGTMGYRVVSSTTSLSNTSNKLIWTLERRKPGNGYVRSDL